MKIHNTIELNQALKLFDRIIKSKSVMPILSNIQITLSDDYFTFKGTDLQQSVIYTCWTTDFKRDNHANFDTTVNYKLFKDIIKGKESIDISYADTYLTIDGSKLNCVSADEYPTLST